MIVCVFFILCVCVCRHMSVACFVCVCIACRVCCYSVCTTQYALLFVVAVFIVCVRMCMCVCLSLSCRPLYTLITCARCTPLSLGGDILGVYSHSRARARSGNNSLHLCVRSLAHSFPSLAHSFPSLALIPYFPCVRCWATDACKVRTATHIEE